jgi:hypothetical protein
MKHASHRNAGSLDVELVPPHACGATCPIRCLCSYANGWQ